MSSNSYLNDDEILYYSYNLTVYTVICLAYYVLKLNYKNLNSN